MKPVLTVDSFYPKAKNLRQHFDSQFEDPKQPQGNRFVWDYWHVPNQYTLVRTPAYHYFPKALYQDFHSTLVQWGRENLGCHDISPTWLSYYVDGCKQELHSDVPHGPWAFVFSITPWQGRKFSGGETLILRPEVLDYWSNFSDGKDHEQSSFVEKVPAKFNRLVVFDPRFPHGVTEVRGTHDPREARLVMHGWFVNPRPYVVGGLSTREAQAGITEALIGLQEEMERSGELHGTLSFRLDITPSGQVKGFRWLTNTLVSLEHNPQSVKYFCKNITKVFSKVKFAKKARPSQMTIPLLFRNG